ncbi:hypothetical protein [Pedobacter sp.]|uniref:hypothetical protein n=1 Tax=Pedobacter sp. TaxID=1411316 RepID=UPI0031DA3795
MKILITGGKTATSLKLIKAFDRASIILGDYGDAPSIKVNAYEFASLGAWNAEVLAHNLLAKCLDHGVDVLLPLYEAEIEAVSKSLVLFEEFGLKVLLPEPEQLAVLLNGTATKQWAIFDKGVPISAELLDAEATSRALTANLNGAYYFNAETEAFTLVSIQNPS